MFSGNEVAVSASGRARSFTPILLSTIFASGSRAACGNILCCGAANTSYDGDDDKRRRVLSCRRVSRYDKALRRLTGKAHDEISLHKYRKESRTAPDEFEKGRLDGYTDAARVAMAALFGGSEYGYARDLIEAVFPWVKCIKVLYRELREARAVAKSVG